MFDRKLISISIASALLTSSLAVSANTQKDDEKDSVNSWGKWAQQYATAAGGEFNTNSLNFASLGQGETGRNGQNEPGFEQGLEGACEAGSFCGFTAFTVGVGPIERQEDIDGAEGFGVAYVDLEVVPNFFDNDNEQVFALIADQVDGDYGSPVGEGPVDESKTGTFSIRGTNLTEVAIDDLSERQPDRPWGEALGRGEKNEEGYSSFDIEYWRGNGALIRGEWEAEYSNFSENVRGEIYAQFAGGVTTSLSELNSFVSNLNGTTATYRGTSFDWNNNRTNRMNYLTVNFGTKTWDAQWNGGSGGEANAGGQSFGRMGFEVNGGTVQGINLIAGSSQLSAADGAVTGAVNGAIFGSQAESVAGLIDIEKTFVGDQEATTYQAVFRGQLNDGRLPR